MPGHRPGRPGLPSEQHDDPDPRQRPRAPRPSCGWRSSRPRTTATSSRSRTSASTRYANAADDGAGGTGPHAHEGLNQRSAASRTSQAARAYGVISQRPGRNQDGGGALAMPVTSFKLNWWWERFAYPGSQYCKMTLTLRTDTDRAVRAELARRDRRCRDGARSTTTIPGVGDAVVTLRARSTAIARRAQTVAFRPAGGRPGGVVHGRTSTSRARGRVDDHVDAGTPDLGLDPTTGLLGPVDAAAQRDDAAVGRPSNGVKRRLRAVVVHGATTPAVPGSTSARSPPRRCRDRVKGRRW